MTEKRHLYMDIQQKIKHDIRALPPHTRIKSRAQMIRTYGVTGTTIEKAISELVGQGFLYARKGSGTYITERSSRSVAHDSFARLSKHDARRVASWAVVVPDVLDDFYTAIIRGVEDVSQMQNANVVLCNTDNDPDKQAAYFEKLLTSGVDGLIVVPAISPKSMHEQFSQLQERGIPFVFCNRGIPGIEAPRVLTNNFQGGCLAAKHLISHGFRRIAFVSTPKYSVAEERYQGYLAGLYEAGLPIDSRLSMLLDYRDQEAAGREAGMAWFAMEHRPDAVVCFNDRVAQGVYAAAEKFGLRIGKEIGIIGHGDLQICDKLPIKLTSVRYPKYETGLKAAELLLRMINGDQLDKDAVIYLQSDLIVRESCGMHT